MFCCDNFYKNCVERLSEAIRRYREIIERIDAANNACCNYYRILSAIMTYNGKMDSYTSTRLIVFISSLCIFSCLEYFFPFHKRELPRTNRWPHHLMMTFLCSGAAKIMLPLGLAYFATLVQEHQLGLWHYLPLSPTLKMIFSLIILDLAIFIEHYFSHKIPFLWRFHRVHHTDIDLDTSSALRFHPLEIVFSLFYKAIIIMIFGIDLTTILLFEILLNFMALFNHSNLALPKWLEKPLRFLVVTPQMHVIHHSTEQKESDSNFGFNLSCWDFIFKTYTHTAAKSMVIGQKDCRSAKEQHIAHLVSQPFKNPLKRS